MESPPRPSDAEMTDDLPRRHSLDIGSLDVNDAPERDRADSEPSKKHAFDLKGAGREASMADFKAFLDNGADYQVMALNRPLEPETVVRIVALRHGMGHHNDAFQTASFMNRDAELNRIGIAQALKVGEILRSAGLFAQRLLVVVSPFCRTLQTAVTVIGTDTWEHPTIVQPLAAETSVASRLPGPRLARKALANVQQVLP